MSEVDSNCMSHKGPGRPKRGVGGVHSEQACEEFLIWSRFMAASWRKGGKKQRERRKTGPIDADTRYQ